MDEKEKRMESDWKDIKQEWDSDRRPNIKQEQDSGGKPPPDIESNSTLDRTVSDGTRPQPETYKKEESRKRGMG